MKPIKKTLNLTNEEYNAVEVAIDHLVEHLTDSLADTFEDDLNLQPKLDATLRVRRKLRRPQYVKQGGVSFIPESTNPWLTHK
jgi:hypothetical protein